jgi:hypothetical protein
MRDVSWLFGGAYQFYTRNNPSFEEGLQKDNGEKNSWVSVNKVRAAMTKG